MISQPGTDFFHDQTLQVVKLGVTECRGGDIYKVEKK